MKRTTDVLTWLGALVIVLAAAAALTDCGGSKTGRPSSVGGATQGTGGATGVGGTGAATLDTGGVTATSNGGSTGAAGGGSVGGVIAGTGGGGPGGNPGGTGGIAGRLPRTGGAAGTAGAAGGGLTGGAGGAGGSSRTDGCPAALPNDGDSCFYSGRGALKSCYYDECPPETVTGPRYVASCPTSPSPGESWTVGELDCPPAIKCGECPPGLDCAASCRWGDTCGIYQCPVEQICLRMVYPDGHWNWECAANNCEAQPLDCSCVGAVCGQRARSGVWQCTAADAPTITCECIDGC
jgi:hypothetical protein